jgi:hypothetical protein
MLAKRYIHLVISILLGIFGLSALIGFVSQTQAAGMQRTGQNVTLDAPILTGTQQSVYLPLTINYFPLKNFFGVESTVRLAQGSTVYSNTVNLQVGWIRLNGRISWRSLQPNEGDPIQWSQLTGFEEELRVLKEEGITPVVIINDYPRWATDNTVRQDGQPTSCGKLLDDKVDDFAVFVKQIVNRYKVPEFGVHNWELGNEPDVDPNLVPTDSAFGCWGDIADPYYGGEAYGRMVIQAGSAMRAADPSVKIWLGGLLLDTPYTTDPTRGHPEKFLEGVLRVGAAPYFDILPYHWYPSYRGEGDGIRDLDLLSNKWVSWGGGTVGKARYLRQIMQTYGVSKPLFLNETSFICSWDPPDAFFDLQANYVVRSLTRAYNEDIMGITWYTVNGPGWRWGGLANSSQTPTPVYWAYQEMTSQYQHSRLIGPVSYADGIEAYAFDRGTDRLDILWAIEDQTITVTVPLAEWIGAYGREGEVITPTVSGANVLLPVGFSPVYLIQRP